MIEIQPREFTKSVAVLKDIDGDIRAIELSITEPFKTPQGLMVQAQPVRADGTKGKVLFKDVDILNRDIEQAKAMGVTVFVESVPTPA